MTMHHTHLPQKQSITSISGFDKLFDSVQETLSPHQINELNAIIARTEQAAIFNKDTHNNVGNIVEVIVNTAHILMDEMDIKGQSLLAVLLYQSVVHNIVNEKEVAEIFDQDVAKIVKGLIKTNNLEFNHSAVASDNYVKLLLTFAEDMRVIPIKIASRLYLMRTIGKYNDQFATKLVVESSYIYTSFAHKLGFYKIKTEFEDLYLKYTDRESYDFIVRKISESKESRDKYIEEFIAPIEKVLKGTGIKYDIKGRVKSISSINNKLKKQKIDFESIYDLFAIRIIIDAPIEKEKAECWQAYSVVTDLYVPNPKRLKDWLSIPKSNGYESLHTTVMGPQSRWVEVQIRTLRMDDIAEMGLAAHWKYKGVKNQSRVDEWLTALRETLENQDLDTAEKLDHFRLDKYDDEIYVFTPKGDLHKLPQGATILDFAFAIHSRIGTTCLSGKVNGRNVPIRHLLNNGDQVEIVTSPNQTPRQDWLGFVSTSKAKNKIRQCLKEESNKQVDLAKEMLLRRFKNRKIEINESVLMRVVKKLKFKNLTDFYVKIAEGTLEVNTVLDHYAELVAKESEHNENTEAVSADKYVKYTAEQPKESENKDELVIGEEDMSGLDYKLARCCNPIYGDDIFGFVSTQGVRIHRLNCPNAKDMFSRFGYRIIASRWSGKSDSNYSITLRVIGIDDIGIVNNLTSIITKEQGVSVRSISIDSNDGVFHGNISVTLSNTSMLNMLLKKLRAVKGVKEIDRLN